MTGPINLRVITPEHIAMDTTCSSIVFPTIDGFVGVHKDHAPMVAALGAGELAFHADGGATEGMFIAGGFAEVRDNTVRIVTVASEPPSDSDVERARRAAERARERLDANQVEGGRLDLLRAQYALQRALLRIRVATKYNG